MAIPPKYPLLTLMQLEQKHVASIKATLKDASEQLERELAAFDKGNGNPLTRMQLEAQRASVQAMMDQTFKDVQKSVAAGREEAAESASGVVSRYENELLKLVLDPQAVKALAASEAKRAVSGLDAALARISDTSATPLSKQVYKTGQIASGWVDQKINQALVSGWSASRLAKEVADSFNPATPGGVSYAANRLARTEINNAFHATSAQRYAKSNLVEYIDWHLSSSHPEGDICDSYASDSPYDKRNTPMKPHPNCYCFITPALPSEKEFMDNLFAGKYDDDPFRKDIDSDTTNETVLKYAPNPSISKSSAIEISQNNAKVIQDRYGELQSWLVSEGKNAAQSNNNTLGLLYRYTGYDRTIPGRASSLSDDVLFRAVNPTVGETGAVLRSADNVIEQFIYGEHYVSPNAGMYANGSYFVDNRATAIAEYATSSDSKVIAASLKSDAKILDLSSPAQISSHGLRVAFVQIASEVDDASREFLEQMDLGSIAVLLGYDGIRLSTRVGGGSVYVTILNRAALVVEAE